MSNYKTKYCEQCQNILPLPNPKSPFIICSECFSQNKIGNNTVVIEETYNVPIQSYSQEVVINLSRQLTTEKIFYDCSQCDNDICSKIHDNNMVYVLVCDNCHAIYNPQ